MTHQALNVSQAMAEYIRAAGVDFMFGYPGTSNIELMEAARERDVETILARREGTAAFMAEGHGMVTGRPGVCISTLGPGSTALLNGVAAAQLDRVPMLAISGQIGSQREPYTTHQVVDHRLLFSPVTKWTGRMEADAVAPVMRKALRTAMAERPGAVHLTVNSDIAKQSAGDIRVGLPPLAEDGIAAAMACSGLGDPLAALRDSQRPVLLVGAAAMRQGATKSLLDLAQTLGGPVVVSPMAKGVFPEDHELFAGVLDMACNAVMWDLLAEADLILATGFDPVELIKPWQVSTPVIHIDAVANTDQIYPADVELIGHIPTLVAWLAEEYDGSGSSWGDGRLEAHRGRLRDAYYAGRVSDRLNPTDVIDAVAAWAGDDAIVTTDVGSHKLLVGQGWQTRHPNTCLMSNGLSSMGFSLPAAIGAKIALPDRQVICTTGDGGFAMVQGELRLASSLGLGIVVIVFCDNSLNRIELKQMAAGYPSTATRIQPTNLPLLAESMECYGEAVDSVRSLEKLLSSSSELDRPLVIQAEITPSQYESQF